LGPLVAIGSKFGVVGVVVAVGLYFGGQFLLGGGGPQALSGDRPSEGGEQLQDESAQFVAFVLDDTQNTWKRVFAEKGQQYVPAKLVLFTDRTQTACGSGSAAMGPFYCPMDQRVFIDLGFFRELEQRFGAPGDFAQAYVIAHEVGHHVQHLLGYDSKKRAAGRSAEGASGASVRLELQADCFAGIWAHSTDQRELLERGDIEEGLRAAASVGDDRLQRQGTGAVNPETWTHGSAEQRSRWFRRGYEHGRIADCDTSGAEIL
jgi:uncharacterized protein